MKKLYMFGSIPLILLIVLFSCGYIFAQTVPMDMTTTDTSTPAMEDATLAMPEGPSISNVFVTDITDTSARVDVNSDELVQGYVEYGTSEQYGMSTPLTSEFSTSPSFFLENLTPETLYHYRVVVVDSAGNAAITGDETFTTLATPVEPEPETPPTSTSTPLTSSLAISDTETIYVSTTTARINWQTNKKADSQVEYGTTNAYGILSLVVVFLWHTQ